MSETDTQTARSSSRDAHSTHGVPRVIFVRRERGCALALPIARHSRVGGNGGVGFGFFDYSERTSSPLMGEATGFNGGKGGAVGIELHNPLTLTLSHEGRGDIRLCYINRGRSYV